MNATLPQIANHAGKSSLIRGSLNVTLGRESFNEAFKNAGKNFVFDVVGRVGANQIGQLYQNGNGAIGYGTHKLLHGAFGAGLGAFKGDPLAGAIGGMVSEIVAEAMVDKEEIILDRVLKKAETQGIEIDSEQFYDLIADETRTAMEFGKLGAALSVALAGRDINVGIDVATNAVENNFAPMVYVALLAGGQALSLLNTVLTTVDAVEAYEKNGLEGVRHLLSEDAAIAMSTAGFGKPTVKIKNLLQRLKSIKLKGIQLNRGASSSTSMGIDLDGNLVPKGKGRAVEGENRIQWVDENASMNIKARAYNDSVEGARSNSITKLPQAPSLNYINQEGKTRVVRFDGIEEHILIDRKLAIVTTEKAKKQALRQSEALSQNLLTGRWEVPNLSQQLRAQKMLSELKIDNIKVEIANVEKFN